MSTPANVAATEERVEPYALPLMEGRVVTRHGELTTGKLPTADDIATLIEQSKTEGYTAGYQEGFERGQQDINAKIELLTQVAKQLDSPLDALDDEVMQSIAALAAAVAKSVVRTHLIAQPEEIVAVVRDAVEHLPLSDREITIHLHPEDLTLVESTLNEQPIAHAWTLHADTSLSPGGLIVNTNISTVDATLETRIEKIASAMKYEEPRDVE